MSGWPSTPQDGDYHSPSCSSGEWNLMGIVTSILDRFLYRPDVLYAPAGFTPASLRMDFEDVNLLTSDGLRLHGWYLRAPKPRFSLLYCHGNAGDCRDWVNAAPPFVSDGCNLLLFDYRGYGRSEGKPSERGLYLDGEAAWQWLRERSDQWGLPASVLGKSLGSAVAAHIATVASPSSVILDSALASVRDVASAHVPWLPRWLIPKVYETLERAPSISCPVLMIHGGTDRLAPLDQSLRLYDLIRAPKIHLVIGEARHNDIDSYARYHRWVLGFLSDPLGFIADCRATENPRATAPLRHHQR
jgi:fermentation-respiration switch protein FrsA (DUF1100 family)